MSEIVKGRYRKTKRIIRIGEDHTIHIKNVDDELYEEAWSLRHYINAHDWVDLLIWAVEKHKAELKQLGLIP